jgi:hypothetical protein
MLRASCPPRSTASMLTIRGHLAKADPASDVWLHELDVSNKLIGDVLMDQGNLAEG